MSPSGPTFQDDLRTIREQRGVAREEIHERTKISLENIARFERGELDQHPHFNEVYLRALVRAYADALGISEEVALQGLERSQAGTYEGELGRVYLGRGEDSPEGAPAEAETGGSEQGPQAPQEETTRSGAVEGGSGSGPEEGDSEIDEAGFEEEPADPEEIEDAAEDVPLPRVSGSPLDFGGEEEEHADQENAAGSKSTSDRAEPAKSETGEGESHLLTRDPDEFDQGEGSGERASETGEKEKRAGTSSADTDSDAAESAPAERGAGGEGLVGEATPVGGTGGGGSAKSTTGRGVSSSSTARRASTRRGSGSRRRGGFGRYRLTGRLALGAGVLILLAGLVWVGVMLLSGSSLSGSSSSERQSGAPAPAAVDTPATAEPPEPAGPPLPGIGDSLEVTVVAATGVLEPVRVRRDGGNWNPYWIEEGDSMTFGATGALELRSYLPRAELVVEGLSWPHSASSLADSVLITREAVQQRIDSMAAARGGPSSEATDTTGAAPSPNR